MYTRPEEDALNRAARFHPADWEIDVPSVELAGAFTSVYVHEGKLVISVESDGTLPVRLLIEGRAMFDQDGDHTPIAPTS